MCVAGPGYVLVTFHTLDDVPSGATVGNAYTLSTEGGTRWREPAPVSDERWRAENLGGVINGIGLRERAERLADGDVFWAYGDGRHAEGSAAGRVTLFGALIRVGHDSSVRTVSAHGSRGNTSQAIGVIRPTASRSAR